MKKNLQSNTGGQAAFPVMGIFSQDEKVCNEGITILQFLSTKAPDQIPAWFQPVMENEKPSMRELPRHKFGSGSTHKHKDLFTKFYDDENGDWADKAFTPDVVNVPADFRKEVDEYIKARDAEYEAQKEWDKQKEIEKYFQWRIYFADQLLVQLESFTSK